MRNLYRVHDHRAEHFAGYCTVAADHFSEAVRLVEGLPGPLPRAIVIEPCLRGEVFSCAGDSIQSAEDLASKYDEPTILQQWWPKPTDVPKSAEGAA